MKQRYFKLIAKGKEAEAERVYKEMENTLILFCSDFPHEKDEPQFPYPFTLAQLNYGIKDIGIEPLPESNRLSVFDFYFLTA